MSEMRHERPGVYSVYDASSVTSAGRAAKRIGVAALAVKDGCVFSKEQRDREIAARG